MSDWVRTADELPPPDRWVLGWLPGATRAYCVCRRDGWVEVDGENYDPDTPLPTHWQPLPPTPFP